MLTVWMSQCLRIVLLTITLHKGDKMKYLLIIATALLIGGCAEQILAVPGMVVNTVGNVTSSVWDLLTGWLPGSGSEVSE